MILHISMYHNIFKSLLVMPNFFSIIPKYRKRIKYNIDEFFSYVSCYSRFPIFFKEMASVEVLCNIAVVVGCITPATPRPINPALNPTILR